MDPNSKGEYHGLFVQWLRGTFFGWLLGVVLTIFAIIAVDAIGVQGTQFLIGAGMGMGVGYVQARTMRQLFGGSGRWLWVTVLGMALPFVIFDLTRILGVKLGYSLPLCVAAGGVLVGALQRGILRSHSNRANWWVPASVVGWLLAAGTVVLNDRYLQEVLRRNIPGVLGALIYLGVILSGGLALGAVTGGALAWMFRPQPS